MHELAKRAIDERSYAKVAADRLPDIVRLAIAEIRRGRHERTMREYLGHPEECRDFLFDFISRRIDLEPLKPTRFISNRHKASSSANVSITLPQPVTDADAVPNKRSRATRAISEEDVKKAVARWFRQSVPSEIWGESA
jgi:hypothetical protein